MTYTPNQLEPPEPARDDRQYVVCEWCKEEQHMDDCINLGSDITQYWCCWEKMCLSNLAQDFLAELLSRGIRV